MSVSRGQVAGSMRKTVENLRAANAGLVKANAEWQDRCLAMQADRDEWRTIAEEVRGKLDEVTRLYNGLRTERDALRQRVEELEQTGVEWAATWVKNQNEIERLRAAELDALCQARDAEAEIALLRDGLKATADHRARVEAERDDARALYTETERKCSLMESRAMKAEAEVVKRDDRSTAPWDAWKAAEAEVEHQKRMTECDRKTIIALEEHRVAEREKSERLRAALGFAYTELCEIERLNTSSKEQARHIFRAIGFCKWDKQPEWDERMTAALAPEVK